VKWKSGAMTIIWVRRTPAMFTAGNDISAATSNNFDKSTPPLDLEFNKEQTLALQLRISSRVRGCVNIVVSISTSHTKIFFLKFTRSVGSNIV
jgi:hypothetical protein